VPESLLPEQIFLGKYLIIDIIPYSKVIKDRLTQNGTVFKEQWASNRKGPNRSNKGSINNMLGSK
jgi:hypothetical protein